MKSLVVKHSVVINGHKTSVSLEDAFWNSLKKICHTQNKTLSAVVELIDTKRDHRNLSSAIRLFVLHWLEDEILSLRAGAAMAA